MHLNERAKGQTRRIRLMIVDTHRLCCMGLGALFRSTRSIEVVAAANGADEAVGFAKRYGPDVVLMDVALPDRGAFRAAERIMTSGLQTRVVFIDDSVCHANACEAVHVGGAGYWTRHATLEELTEAVRRAAAGSLTFCSAVRSRVVYDANGVRFDAAQGHGVLGKVSRREIELLTHLASGLSVRECAQRMRLANSTAKNYKSRLMKKLGARKGADLVRLAVQEGLVGGKR